MSLKRFIDATFTPFFLFTGFGTMLISLYAIFPQWSITTIGKLPYFLPYTIIIQHWGIMVGLMGVFMMYVALREDGRTPILLFSAIEKAFMVYLVILYHNEAFSDGFLIAAMGDGTIVVYTILYFLTLKTKESL